MNIPLPNRSIRHTNGHIQRAFSNAIGCANICMCCRRWLFSSKTSNGTIHNGRKNSISVLPWCNRWRRHYRYRPSFDNTNQPKVGHFIFNLCVFVGSQNQSGHRACAKRLTTAAGRWSSGHRASSQFGQRLWYQSEADFHSAPQWPFDGLHIAFGVGLSGNVSNILLGYVKTSSSASWSIDHCPSGTESATSIQTWLYIGNEVGPEHSVEVRRFCIVIGRIWFDKIYGVFSGIIHRAMQIWLKFGS